MMSLINVTKMKYFYSESWEEVRLLVIEWKDKDYIASCCKQFRIDKIQHCIWKHLILEVTLCGRPFLFPGPCCSG